MVNYAHRKIPFKFCKSCRISKAFCKWIAIYFQLCNLNESNRKFEYVFFFILWCLYYSIYYKKHKTEN